MESTCVIAMKPYIQMQKTGLGIAYQGDTSLPASDLERWTHSTACYDQRRARNGLEPQKTHA